MAVDSHLFNQIEAGWTWDMLKMWTELDIEKLRGEKINVTPANAIFMTAAEHVDFGRFNFILEEVGPLFVYGFFPDCILSRSRVTNTM
jgi:hypothetical protein